MIKCLLLKTKINLRQKDKTEGLSEKIFSKQPLKTLLRKITIINIPDFEPGWDSRPKLIVESGKCAHAQVLPVFQKMRP